MRQRMCLKSAATHEELERLTAEYLAAGNKIRRCAPKKRRNEMRPSVHKSEKRERA
jgi:hypothetical protein